MLLTRAQLLASVRSDAHHLQRATLASRHGAELTARVAHGHAALQAARGVAMAQGSAEGAPHHHLRPAAGRSRSLRGSAALAHAARIEPDRLIALVRQADLARVQELAGRSAGCSRLWASTTSPFWPGSSPADCTSGYVGATQLIASPAARLRREKLLAGSGRCASCQSWSPTRPRSGRRAAGFSNLSAFGNTGCSRYDLISVRFVRE